MKPLFIPLMREFYEAFKRGDKDTEYRINGKRWNEWTCVVNRPVVLSLGYGKGNRLTGKIIHFYKTHNLTEDFKRVYAGRIKPDTMMVCIQIILDARGER